MKSIIGAPLATRVRLRGSSAGQEISAEFPDGAGQIAAPAGTYDVFVYAYDASVPILVHVERVTLESGKTAVLAVEVLEGSSGNRPLSAFDKDFDLALDRVELEQGTDPADARSVPGESPMVWPSPVLRAEGGWYRGELHAYSSQGPGSESVAQLIRRAESAGLDFLAITDPNTLAAAQDPQFKSDRVVLIPAMEWRHPSLGTALLYAPASVPPPVASRAEAQALANKLQAQGGLFAIAHPTLPGQAWQWGLEHFNAVEIWFGEWRATRPMPLEALSEDWRRRNDKNNFIHPIATAVATQLLSANGQASVFYDLETSLGAHAAAIAGSGSKGKKQRLGTPMTYVWAREKSLAGILEGIRVGRTFVTAGPDAPFIEFMADIMGDGSTDVGSGGMVPVNVKSQFFVGIDGAKGARIEILFNGHPLKSHIIEHDRFLYSMGHTPGAVGVYRVRILDTPKQKGYGPAEILAMSSPIYAQSYYVDPATLAANRGWVDIKSNWEDPATVQLFDPSSLDPSQVLTLDSNSAP